MYSTPTLKIFYRISDAGYNKIKPSFINNETCLRNFINEFGTDDLVVIADNVSDSTMDMICNYVPYDNILKCKMV